MKNGRLREHSKIGWTLRITQGEKHRSNVVSRGSVFLHASYEALPNEEAMFKDIFDEEFPSHI